jgi:hypothetical protein
MYSAPQVSTNSCLNAVVSGITAGVLVAQGSCVKIFPPHCPRMTQTPFSWIVSLDSTKADIINVHHKSIGINRKLLSIYLCIIIRKEKKKKKGKRR